jgi:hypothetical protein
MRKALLMVSLIINLLPFDAGYAGSFVITQGFWNTRGDAVSTSFSSEGLTGTASGFGFMTPMSGDTLLAGSTFTLGHTLVSEAGNFTVEGATFPVNTASPSSYTLQVTGGPVTLPTSFAPSLTLESTALLAGTLWLCADHINPCVNHSVTGTGVATLQFAGRSLAGASPTYQLSNLHVMFGAESDMSQNTNQAVASLTHAQLNNPSVIFNPEPATLLLLGSGLIGVGMWKRTRRKENIHH